MTRRLQNCWDDCSCLISKSLSKYGRGLVGLFLVLSVLRLCLLVGVFSKNLFAWDQWDFLDPLFHPLSFWEEFRWQHGPHRMGIGLPWMLFLLRASAWNAVILSWASVVIFFLTTLLALSLKRKLLGPFRWTDLVIPLLVMNFSQFEVFLLVPNLSHWPLALFFVFLFCHGLILKPSLYRTVFLIGIDLLASHSGYGVFLSLIVPFVFLYDLFSRKSPIERIPAQVGLISSVGVIFLFLYGYHFRTSISCFEFPDPHPENYPAFFVLIFARAFGRTQAGFVSILLGAVIVIAVVLAGVHSFRVCTRRKEPIESVILSLIVFSLLFAANASFARVCQGAQAGLASRYVSYVLPCLFALYLKLLQFHQQKRKYLERLLTVFVVVYALLDGLPTQSDRSAVNYCRVGKLRWISCYLQQRDASECNRQSGFVAFPEPNDPIFQEKLDRLEKGRLGFFYD